MSQLMQQGIHAHAAGYTCSVVCTLMCSWICAGVSGQKLHKWPARVDNAALLIFAEECPPVSV